MRRRIWGGRATRATSTVMLSAATVAFIVIAALAQGFPVRHVSANDASVWLTDDAAGAFGRYNDAIGQLADALNPPGAFQSAYDLDVLQEGTTVLAEDRSRGDLYPIDPAAGTVDTKGVSLPGGAGAQVALGGTVAAVLDPTTGRLWAAVVGSGSHAALSALVTTGRPLLKLQGAAAMTVAQDGTVFVASPGELVTYHLVRGTIGPAEVRHFAHPFGAKLTLTAAGGVPAILDEAARAVDLPDSGAIVFIPPSDTSPDLVVQQAGPAADEIVVASDSTAYGVPVDGGSPKVLLSGGAGKPAQPVRLGSCVHAAWAGGPGRYGRACAGQAAFETSLAGDPLIAPVFRVNNSDIILNDTVNGDAWSMKNPTVQALNSGDWTRLLESLQPNVNPNSPQTGRDRSLPRNQPPVAKDDHLQARPGHSTVLHVLDNDSDPSGSVLTIINVSPATGPHYQAQISPDGQTISLQMDSGATVPVDFQYTISNAGGQTATATVTVTPTSAETAPHPEAGIKPVTDHQSSGSSATYQVLSTWRDDEGDPLSITGATVSQGTVTWTGDGLLTYTAPTVPADTPLTVTYQVSDGLSAPAAGQLQVVVLGQGDTTGFAPTPEPDAYQVVVGKPADVQPLQNDVGGADPLHPTARLALAGPLGAPAGLTVATDTATGTVTITAQQPGIYALTYQDSFGSAPTASGQILVRARAAAAGPEPPVVVPTSVLLHGQLPSTVNVAGADYDPDGGVLTVVGVNAPSDIQATVVDGAYLRLAANASSLSGQQTVSYEITNGTTQPVTGQTTVTWAPPLPPSPPVVPDIQATVRAADEVDVPVLGNATDPAGEPLHLLAGVVSVSPADAGSASVTAGVLRYAAPPASAVPTVRQVTATYVVEDSSGERTTGKVDLTVNPVDPATDHAPQPKVVVARVTAGGTVTVPIPTSGVDPDGDSVALTGLADPPQLGRILSSTQSSITFQAYPTSGGTDDLTYVVTDPYGQTGQASLRIAVDPVGQALAPVAVPDDVTGAPGQALIVPILANDLVAPRDQVQIEPLAQTNSRVPAGARLVGQDLEVVAPSGAAPLVVTYAISDGVAPPSEAQVTVRSQPGYVVPPIAVDDYPKAPTPDQATVRVHVLANDSDPTGSPDDLKVVSAFSSAAHVDGNDVVVDVQPNPQVIAYEIRNPGGGTAVGAIHLPGASPGPVLKPGAGTISVPHNGTANVDINQYIADTHGPVHLVSSSEVFTAPSSGLTWRPASYTTLQLVGTAGYDGPGSLTVQVSDAKSPTDKLARTALVSIPVQVGAAAPAISCPSTPLTVIEGGAALSLHLAEICQVYTPDPATAATLPFTAAWGTHPNGVSFSLGGANRDVLSVQAGSNAAGQSGAIMVSVQGATTPAKLPITVVVAPPPTIGAVSIPGVLTNHAATVDLRQYVSSPFASPSVAVVSVQQTGQGTAQVSHAGSSVTITPQSGTHGLMTFTALVTDIASRPDRAVPTTISAQVLDVPGVPGAVQGVTGNQQVALSWAASAANGSPVAYYTVTQGGQSHRVNGTSYTWAGLTNGTSYSFSVTAHNQVGDSPGASTASFSPQAKPGAPGPVQATGADSSVALTWQPAIDNGQPIDSYLITVSGGGGGVQTVAGTSTSYTWSGLNNNNGPYTFTVVAHNSLGVGPSTSSNSVYAHAAPPAPTAPTAAQTPSLDNSSETDTVTFAPVAQCNDAQPCKSYVVTQYKDGSAGQSQTVNSCNGATCSASFGSLSTDGSQYTYTLTDTNPEGETSQPSAMSNAVVAVEPPAKIATPTATKGYKSIQVTFTVPQPHGKSIVRVEYSFNGTAVAGSWTDQTTPNATASETISGLTPGQTYSVEVRGCNESACGDWSSAASATPYGDPSPPSVSATGSGIHITFTWNGGGGGNNNGPAIASYNVCIDGSCSNQGANGGQSTQVFACGTSHTISATVTDTQGHTSSSNSATASTPQCQATIAEGGAATTSYCNVAGCNAVSVSLSNFAPNASITIYFSTDCANQSSAVCSTTQGGTSNYASQVITTDGNGDYTNADDRSFGYHGSDIWFNVNAPYPGGTQSNTINWN